MVVFSILEKMFLKIESLMCVLTGFFFEICVSERVYKCIWNVKIVAQIEIPNQPKCNRT